MGRLRPLPIDKPDKPPAEMTPSELAAYMAKVRRTLRDDEVRRGARRPRTMREVEIWRQAQAEREERRAKRIARVKRKQERRTAQ
jgi:hypothetical protein